MNVTFWGVRGSIPTPDIEQMRWGGNTSCVEVWREDGSVLVLDCGTGARRLGTHLVDRGVSRVDVLFSHVHIDHILALPFFAPVHRPDVTISITVPAFTDLEASEKVARYLNGTLHPLRVGDLASQIVVRAVRPGPPFERAGFTVSACALNHPGGALAYRIEDSSGVFCYVTDTAPLAVHGTGVAAKEPPSAAEERLMALMADADLVIFDTMFSQAEYMERMNWGHAYPEYAVALCEAAGVKRLGLFHHLPSADDTRLDALSEHWRAYAGPLEVFVCKEGSTERIGAPQ